MHNHEYSDDCEGCQPALMDAKTGKPMSKNDPVMVLVQKAWKEKTTFEQRRTTTRVWMGQSVDPKDIAVMQEVSEIMQAAMKEHENANKIPGSDQ